MLADVVDTVDPPVPLDPEEATLFPVYEDELLDVFPVFPVELETEPDNEFYSANECPFVFGLFNLSIIKN